MRLPNGHSGRRRARPTAATLLAGAVVCLAACAGTEPTATAPRVKFQGITAALTIDPEHLPNYDRVAWPAYYDSVVRRKENSPLSNPVTVSGATLGRVLFFDRQLSVNRTVSCASCHHQAAGFADTVKLSLGFDGVSRTERHAMRLGNVRFFELGSALWDRSAGSIEDQATRPLHSPIEMGFDEAHGGSEALLARMRALPYYGELFTIAFRDSVITEDRMQRALAQYLRSIVSVDSKFDRAYAQAYRPGEPATGLLADFADLTPEENRGKHIYMTSPTAGGGGCQGCHPAPTFALASRGNGLDAGEARVFKSPSLKNVARSSSFMHDGRFATLEEVVDFYATGVQLGPALDAKLIAPGPAPRRFDLSPSDRAALVSFLKTLDDDRLASDPKFSDPFRH